MTLTEILEQLTELKESDPTLGDCEVHFQYNFGDYWRTQVAPAVGTCEVGKTVHSPYHGMPKVVIREDESEDCDEDDEEIEVASGVDKPVRSIILSA